MGQHCINNAVQCDLMFDDGTPMDPLHPGGVTGWIREIAGKSELDMTKAPTPEKNS